MANIVDSLIIQLGLDPSGVRRGLDTARREAQNADQHLERLEHKWGGKLAQFAMRIAAPLMGIVSVGKMISTYTSTVAQVAEATGRYSAKLEEQRIKQAQMSRVTKEDIDLYIKVKRALGSFQIALMDFTQKIVSTFAPAIQTVADWLTRISDWVGANSQNIIRFLTVLGTILTALLIPSLIRMARALWANPVTWLVAALAALALVIDDLIVYMQGGESEFAEFWALFGTGAELSEKLGKLWEWIKTTGKDLLPTLLKIGAAFAGWKMLTVVGATLKGVIASLITGVGRLFAVLKAHPFLLLITAIWMWYDNWDEICSGAEALWEDFCELCTEFSDWAIDRIGQTWQGLKDLASDIWEGILSIVDAVVQRLSDTWEGFKALITDILDAILGAFTSVVDSIKQAWINMLNAVIEKVAAVVSAVTGAMQKTKEFFGLATSEEERKRQLNAHKDDPEFQRQLAEVKANRARRESMAAGMAAAGRAAAGVPAVNQAAAAGAKAAAGSQTVTVNNGQTINVNGTGDPQAVAENVYKLEQSGYQYAADSGTLR